MTIIVSVAYPLCFTDRVEVVTERKIVFWRQFLFKFKYLIFNHLYVFYGFE